MVKRTKLQRVIAAIYPERCCSCGVVIICGTLICETCSRELTAPCEPICRLCGRGKAECVCRKHKRYTERIIAPYYYTGATRKSIMRLKLGKQKASAELLYMAMAETVRTEYDDIHFDMIIPVPLSKKTHTDRGFNQSMVIAQGLSEELSIPVYDLLEKIYYTVPQRTLPAHMRNGNVLGVFEVTGPPKISEKTILLVDDIVTTGATTNECAKMLLLHGAHEIYVAAGAVTVVDKE